MRNAALSTPTRRRAWYNAPVEITRVKHYGMAKDEEWLAAAKDNFREALAEVNLALAAAMDIVADTRDAGFREDAEWMARLLVDAVSARRNEG